MIMIWIVYYITPPSSVDTRWPPWTLFHGGFKLKVLSTPQPPTAASSKRSSSSSILVVVFAPFPLEAIQIYTAKYNSLSLHLVQLEVCS